MPETLTTPRPATRTRPETQPPRRWNVVLIDDDEHSYEYVIAMMMELFGHDLPRAFEVARRVDTAGRAICLTTHREHAELKVEQIWSFGPDAVIAESKGPMTAVLEPADDGGDA